jgi:hypothetical protein
LHFAKGGFMDFTPQAAFDYIKGKLDDFYQKGDALQLQEQSITALMVEYQNQGLDQTPLENLMGEVNGELLGWQRIANKLTPILSYFGYTPPGQLGIDPFTLAAIAGTLIAVAALLWSWYNSSRIDAHNSAIKTLAANVQLSPQDQAIVDAATTPPGLLGSLSSIFSGLGTIGSYLVIGGLAYLLLSFSAKRS